MRSDLPWNADYMEKEQDAIFDSALEDESVLVDEGFQIFVSRWLDSLPHLKRRLVDRYMETTEAEKRVVGLYNLNREPVL